MSDWKDKTKPHWVNPQRDRIATLEALLAEARADIRALSNTLGTVKARAEAAETKLAERERELAEAREQRDSNDRACQAALAGNTLATQRARAAEAELAEARAMSKGVIQGLVHRAEATEARLAAVASEMREHVSRRHGISVWQSMVGKWAAALTAPAEPKPVTEAEIEAAIEQGRRDAESFDAVHHRGGFRP